MPDGTAVAPAPLTHIVDTILPCGVVHVISGSSGSGKSQWTLQFLADLHAGRDILGCKSHPVPAVYVSLKQTDAEIRTTLKQAAIAPQTITYISADHDERYEEYDPREPRPPQLVPTFASVLDHALRRDRAMRLLVIDGVDEIIPSGRHSDPQVINTFLAELRAACRRHRLTIIVVGAPAKAKEGEVYTNVRQRLSGSVVWGPGTSTHINIEPATTDPRDRARKITISTRHAQARILDWRFDDAGVLVPSLEGDVSMQMEEWAALYPEGEVLTSAQLRSAALSYGISTASLYRWLRDGGMIDAGHGKWKVRPRTVN